MQWPGEETMVAPESPEPFSLLGGPLHQLGRRLGLVRDETNTVRLGLALGWGMYLMLGAITVMEGAEDRFFSMSLIGSHVRLLLAIPLFFMGESWVVPRMAAFVSTIRRSGVVPPGEQPALDAAVARTRRMANQWWPEAVCLLAAVLLEITGWRLQTYGETGTYDSARTTLAFFAYFHSGLTVFRFLVFRWVWKLALWGWFLWRISRLDLHLIAGHPDRAGGLGSLEGVHERFTPLVVALSVIECASLAESISTGVLAARAVYPTLALLLLLDTVLFIGPLLVFTDKLWAGRTKGVGRYMALAARYVTEFEAKWTGDSLPADEPLLGSADFQSLADLSNAINTVKGMRWITVGPRLLTVMTIAAVAPLTPLLLFRYPLGKLAEKFFSRLVGF
jgi:hypothetical protein